MPFQMFQVSLKYINRGGEGVVSELAYIYIYRQGSEGPVGRGSWIGKLGGGVWGAPPQVAAQPVPQDEL